MHRISTTVVKIGWGKMRRSLQPTVLLTLVLIFPLTLSQPSTSLMQFTRLQRHLITLYEQYRQNASAVDLELFMGASLMRRTHEVIDMIRGWAVDAREEELNVHASINYIRSFVLYAIVTYVDSLYDAFSSISVAIDADIVLHASQISRIRTNYEWQPQPCDPIVRFELMQFQRLALRARAVNDIPYVRVYSTNTASARFFHEISIYSPNASLGFTPLPRNPQANVLIEVDMLAQAQNLVLFWSMLRSHSMYIELHNQIFWMNNDLSCFMHKTLDDLIREHSLTSQSINTMRSLHRLMNCAVLQRYMQFVLSEFGRHAHHPAHFKYAHAIDVNATRTLNENQVQLLRAYKELITSMNAITVNNEINSTFHSLILNYLPLRVTYVRYPEHFTLRVDLACPHEF